MSQRRIRIPVADKPSPEPAHYKRDTGPCHRLAPCGNKCAMEARHDHFYHSCSRAECANCHGAQRFQRGTETA